MNKIYLMNYDANTGEIKGFYPKSLLHLYQEIPEPVLEITQEKHEFYIENNGRFRINPVTLLDEQIPETVASQSEVIKTELKELDEVLPRCVEDLITSQGIDETTLPKIMQDRLSKKRELRQQLRNFYD